MSTSTQTRTVRLLSAEQLREQQETSGRAGLAALLKAVRRLLDWLLMPFRMVGRVLFKPGLAVADNAAAAQPADRAAGSVNTSPGENALTALTNGLAAGTSGDQDLDGLVKQVADNPDGGLDIEVDGKPDDLDVVLPMLMRHIDQILKTHLPSDANETQVVTHLAALAETAEYSRYAHRMVSREVESARNAVLADPRYVGLSAPTIESLVRSAASSPGAGLGDGSTEQRLMSRLALQEKIAADYRLQMREIAAVVAPILGEVADGGEVARRGQDLLNMALQAAEVAGAKLRVRHAVDGTPKVLPETLPEVREALEQAIEGVRKALQEKAAPVAGASEVVEAVRAADVPLTNMEGLAKASPDEVLAAPPALAVVTQAAPAAPQVAVAAAAAVAAVRAVQAGGMFGGVATVQRTQAEMDEVNLVDDAFADSDGENLVAG